MSRTVGPYKDVATARVEGAYELCEGADETGRPVQILTLGSSSSKDPARRGLLSDTVAWAHATTGPDDAPILTADLEAEQPYVVVLRDPRLRGADRIMDRLLALGPATGPLPVGPAAAAQRAVHQQQMAPPGSPSGPPSPPPVSPPVVVIAPPKKRSQLKPILIGVGSVIVILALIVGGWILLSGSGSGDDADGSVPAAGTTDTAAAGEVSQGPEGEAEEAPEQAVPVWNESARGMSVAGTEFGEDDDTQILAYRDWPFAFKVPSEYRCERKGNSAVCETDEGESTVTVGWEVCGATCSDDARESLREALPYQPMQEMGNAGSIGFSQRTEVYGFWRGSLSVFVETDDEVLHVTTVADVLADRGEETKQIFNDVLNQASARED